MISPSNGLEECFNSISKVVVTYMFNDFDVNAFYYMVRTIESFESFIT